MKKFLMLAILGTIVLSGCAQSKENSSKIITVVLV